MEPRARQGAGDTPKDFDALQQSDIRKRADAATGAVRALSRRRMKIAPGSVPRFANEYEAGAGLTTGIRSKEAEASNAIGAAYDEARRLICVSAPNHSGPQSARADDLGRCRGRAV